LLTERGRRFLEHYIQLHTQHAPCPVTADDLVPVVRTLEAVYRRRPGALAPASAAEGSLARALVLCAHGALHDKAVIVLGDSELASLAIGLLGKTLRVSVRRFVGTHRVLPQAARILVVETDPSWIDLIHETAQAEGLEIEVLRHNLRDPLPERLHGQFDTFVTDPPYTAAGMTLFLSRAIQALRPGGGGYGLFSFAHQSPLELLQIHSNLVRMGLVAREIIPTDAETRGQNGVGTQSQMMLLMTTAATRALVPQQPYEAPIYAGESQPTVRFYVCTRCRARYRVGQQYAFVDAESLKQAGCARCGNTRFRYVHRVVPQGALVRGALTDRGLDVEPAWPSTGQRLSKPEPAPASA